MTTKKKEEKIETHTQRRERERGGEREKEREKRRRKNERVDLIYQQKVTKHFFPCRSFVFFLFMNGTAPTNIFPPYKCSFNEVSFQFIAQSITRTKCNANIKTFRACTNEGTIYVRTVYGTYALIIEILLIFYDLDQFVCVSKMHVQP